MKIFEEEFRKAHPETVGETDREFDNANYIDFLEDELIRLKSLEGPRFPVDEDVEFEYELLFKSDQNDVIKIDGWYPIATDRIRHPERIEKYIQNGILRKIKK